MVIIYDNKFDQNEWFVIISLILGIILVWRYRKKFPFKEVLVYSLYFVFISMVMDHTISVEPWDYYDVNDSSLDDFMDFLCYFMYGPYGYFYIYFYDYFKVKFSYTPIYILIWALISVVMEIIAHSLGVFHYKNGYEIYYSFPIYLLILIPPLSLYKLFHPNTTK